MVYLYVDVSKNSGTPQIINFNRVFLIINHPFWGTPMYLLLVDFFRVFMVGKYTNPMVQRPCGCLFFPPHPFWPEKRAPADGKRAPAAAGGRPLTQDEKGGEQQEMGGNPKIVGKPQKWMVKIMENPIKMDDLGGKTPLFSETSK